MKKDWDEMFSEREGEIGGGRITLQPSNGGSGISVTNISFENNLNNRVDTVVGAYMKQIQKISATITLGRIND